MARVRDWAAVIAAGFPLFLAAGSATAGSSQGIIQCDGHPATAGIQDDSHSAPAAIQDDSHPAPAGIQDNWRGAAKPVPKPPGGDAAIQDNWRSHHRKPTHLKANPTATAPTGASSTTGGGN